MDGPEWDDNVASFSIEPEDEPGTVHIFALTGGIGSGKSTVASIWRGVGLPIVDADKLARAAVEPGGAALEKLVSSFGPGILTEDGQLNRPAVAQIIFHDDEARARLNAIVHPVVSQAAHGEFQRWAERGYRLGCYEIPLLFETNQQDRFRPVVVVSVPEPAQLTRLCARDGSTPEQARARIDAQMSLAEKAEDADFVIDNSGSLEETKRQALTVLRRVHDSLPVAR